MRSPGDLANEILKVCPIEGTRHKGPVTEILFKPSATSEQRAAAQAVVDAWNWDAPSAEDVEKEAKKAALLAIDLKKIGDPALKAVVEYLQGKENPQ